MRRPKNPTDAVLRELRAFGLAYPGAHAKSPWPGHMDLAVKNKTFAFLSVEGEPFSISCKLPHSGAAALMLPFAKPTGYGLGKSGWVSAQFPEGQTPPVALLKEWIDESYRARAPKKLIAGLATSALGTSSSTAPSKAAVPKSARRAPSSRRAKGSRRKSGSKR